MFTTLLLATLCAADPAVEADFLIKNTTVIDGTGQPAIKGDLAIKGDRIVALGKFAVSNKPTEIDGTDLIVAPGFIDLHSHSDDPLTQEATRPNLNFLMQGCTTVVTGNCGFGPEDVAGYFKKLEDKGIGSNVIHQVPHNSVRRAAMGNANRPPTAAELKKMEDIVDQGMKDGAFGLATGLIYNPGCYAQTDELIALAKVVARHKGHYASHIRNEGSGLLTAVDEAIRIGRAAGIPVHISHMKASGKQAWGKSADAIGLIEAARQKGERVTADQYPYIASSTSIQATVIPTRYREGTQKELLARLDDPQAGPAIKEAIQKRIDETDGGERLKIARYAKQPGWQGKSLAAIAKQEGKNALDIVLDIERNGGAQIVNFGMSEEDVRLIMKQPWVATASDGVAMTPGDTVPHPRSYGTFPRKLGVYAVELKIVPLEQAIRSSSGLPADVLRLTDRGYLKPGQAADVVVFDAKTFRDTATYDKPHQYATGVKYLFVNGKPVIVAGKYNGARAGRAIKQR